MFLKRFLKDARWLHVVKKKKNNLANLIGRAIWLTRLIGSFIARY